MTEMNTWFTIIFLALCCFPLATNGQDSAFDIKAMYNEGDHEAVIQTTTEWLLTDSTNIDLLMFRAKSQVARGDQSAAKSDLAKIIQKDTTNESALYMLANIYEQQEFLARASKYYSMLNKVAPDNGIYYRKNGRIHQAFGDLPSAFRLYAKAHACNSKDVLAIKAMAELCVENDQLILADSLIRKAVELDPENIGIQYQLATVKYKLKQHDTVIQVLKPVSFKVDLPYYYHKMLGYAYLQSDSFDQSIFYLQKALNKDRNPEKTHFYLANAFEQLDDDEAAKYHMEQAIEHGMSPDLDLYYRQMARMSDQSKDFKSAIGYYQKAYELNQDPVLLYYLARASDIYYKDKSIAIRYYRKYIQSKHNYATYVQYARDRMTYLKEQIHQNNK